MLSWILPKNERLGNFIYWKMPQRSFFGSIQDAIICFWDLLTFSVSDFVWHKEVCKQLFLIAIHSLLMELDGLIFFTRRVKSLFFWSHYHNGFVSEAFLTIIIAPACSFRALCKQSTPILRTSLGRKNIQNIAHEFSFLSKVVLCGDLFLILQFSKASCTRPQPNLSQPNLV